MITPRIRARLGERTRRLQRHRSSGQSSSVHARAAEDVLVSSLRTTLFVLAAGSLILGASGVLSPALSTLLWLPSGLVLACHPASPVVRVIRDSLLRSVNGSTQRPH